MLRVCGREGITSVTNTACTDYYHCPCWNRHWTRMNFCRRSARTQHCTVSRAQHHEHRRRLYSVCETTPTTYTYIDIFNRINYPYQLHSAPSVPAYKQLNIKKPLLHSWCARTHSRSFARSLSMCAAHSQRTACTAPHTSRECIWFGLGALVCMCVRKATAVFFTSNQKTIRMKFNASVWVLIIPIMRHKQF